MITRRTLLTALAAGPAALAGCQSVPGGDAQTPTYALDLDEVGQSLAQHMLWKPPEGDAPWNRVGRDAWRTATGGGDYVTYGFAPVNDGEYTVRDGTYYQLRTTVTGQRSMERPVLRLDWVGRIDELADPPEAVDYGSLPPLDRRAVEAAFFAARARETGGGASWKFTERGGYVYRLLDVGRSRLVPDPAHEFVAFEGVVLRVKTTTETVPEAEYVTTAREVADSRTAFAEVVDAALVDARIQSAELSQEARAVMAEAAGPGAYRETVPLSNEFEEVLRALELQGYLSTTTAECPTGESGRYLAFDGQYYTYALFVSPSSTESGV